MTLIREERAEVESAINTDEGYLTHMCHSDIAFTVHAANKAKGFWPEEAEDRDFGQVIALVHGEISEAYEASWLNGQDDKLPQYKAVAVELVDTIIRLYDALGAYVDYIDDLIQVSRDAVNECTDGIELLSFNDQLMLVNGILSRALDAHRKSVTVEIEIELRGGTSVEWKVVQFPQYHLYLVEALGVTQRLCRVYGYDWEKIMDAKFAFNKTRAHKHGAKY